MKKQKPKKADNLATICHLLAKAGVTRVVADYSGSGDSGQVDSVEFYGVDSLPMKAPDVELPVQQTTRSWSPQGIHVVVAPVTMYKATEAFEMLCYEALSHYFAGWENNDGGCGEFELDLRNHDPKLELKHKTYYTATEEHEPLVYEP